MKSTDQRIDLLLDQGGIGRHHLAPAITSVTKVLVANSGKIMCCSLSPQRTTNDSTPTPLVSEHGAILSLNTFKEVFVKSESFSYHLKDFRLQFYLYYLFNIFLF